MKKRLLGLLLALTLVCSLSVAIFASPGGGIVAEPIMIDPPFECEEDCKGQDDDQDKP